MKVYTYSEARQKLSKVLDLARSEDVMIKKRSGEIFTVVYQKKLLSPFDVKGVKTSATKQDILDAVEESRSMVRRENES